MSSFFFFFFCTLVLYINILSALFDCVVVHKESCLKTPLPVNSIDCNSRRTPGEGAQDSVEGTSDWK